MTDLHRVMALVSKAIDEFDDPQVTTAASLRRCVRIARLRNDFPRLFRLELEAEDTNALDPAAVRAARRAELGAHFDADEWDALGIEAVRSYIARRTFQKEGKGHSFGGSVDALERHIGMLKDQAEKAVPPSGLAPVDLYFRSKELRGVQIGLTVEAGHYERMRDRIRTSLYQFLIDTERELEYGQVNAEIFERNRVYVDGRLGAVAPEALEQFRTAYRRVREGDPESLSHALTSCRRILKSVADSVYPASSEVVVGKDGKQRKLTDERYINRLLQFVSERIGKHGDGEVLQATLDQLGKRLSALDGLASKGVHATVTPDEVDTCVIQTYLMIGDVLRIGEGNSGLTGH